MSKKIPNIFLVGPMGAGKTTIGKRLAQELGAEFYDTDKEVERRSGVPVAWIFDFEGEAGFRKRETQVIEEASKLPGIVLATGGGAVLASQNRTMLASRGIVVYLAVSLENQIQRISKGRDRPIVMSSQNLKKTLEELQAKRNPLYEEIADYVFVTDHYSVQAVVKEILIQVLKQEE